MIEMNSTGDNFRFSGRRQQQSSVNSTSPVIIDYYNNAAPLSPPPPPPPDLRNSQSSLSARFTTSAAARDSHTRHTQAQSTAASQRSTEFTPSPPPRSNFRQLLGSSLKRSFARISAGRRHEHVPPSANKFNFSSGIKSTSSSSSSNSNSWWCCLPHHLIIKMAHKHTHGLMTLTCVTLFLVACLLGSVVISRSIGSTDDLDGGDSTAAGGQQAAQLSGRSGSPPPPEVFEVRAFELIDLIECDKTFAYTKWRVQVRVRKSAPAYEQHNLAPLPPPQPEVARPEVALNELPIERREIRPVPPSSRTNRAQDQVQDQEYHLTGTRAFVADHQQQQADGDVVNDRKLMSGEQIVGAAATDSFLEDFEDPIQVAASELNVNAGTVNSSLVDCFIVDTDKRYSQKIALEGRHKKLASTRRVGFKKMRAIITACRLLSWTELTAAAANGLSRQSNSSTQSLPSTPRQPNERLVKRADQKATTTTSLRPPFINEIIRPVERTPPPTPPTSEDPFNSLLGALVTWSRQPINETQQRVTMSSTTSSSSSSSTKAAEEEAKRASYLNMGMSMVSGIVPNTLWCGLGDRAANYSELGAEFMVDACCRAHDHCPIRLKPFTTDYGLINWSMSTRSHCDCDLDFSDCLTGANSTLSNVIKTLYFRFVGLQCIDLESNGRKLTTTTQSNSEFSSN